MKMTYDEYDKKCEELQKVRNEKQGWYPDIATINQRIISNVEKYLEYMMWLIETAGKPKTKEMDEGRKYINQLLRENIELLDDIPAF